MQLLVEIINEYLMPEIVRYIVTEVQSMTRSNLCKKTILLSEGVLLLSNILKMLLLGRVINLYLR